MLALFVYGTLLSGEPRSAMVPGRRSPATCGGTLWRLPAGYPALVPGPGGVVHGEIVEPPAQRVLTLLDQYEGVDQGLYRRAVVDVEVDGRTVQAWTYVMDDPAGRGGTVMTSGRWRGGIRR